MCGMAGEYVCVGHGREGCVCGWAGVGCGAVVMGGSRVLCFLI